MGRKRHTPEHIKFLACGTGPGGALRAGRDSHPMLAFRLHPRRGIKLITPLKLPYCGQPNQRKYLRETLNKTGVVSWYETTGEL